MADGFAISGYSGSLTDVSSVASTGSLGTTTVSCRWQQPEPLPAA